MTNPIFDFYRGKRVLVTGHTGFKGSWLCEILLLAGAQVTGYSLNPPSDPSLFELLGLSERMDSRIGDVRDLAHMKQVFEETQPESVLHLAAQPIVRESYKNPVYTYETNVMGTVHLLECARLCPSVRSLVNVTTDKVYENREWEYGYRETDRLDGYDPYSNSKSCSSACRAGNVIGGGDFAADRIVPDCIRAMQKGEEIAVRNPYSTRPYQHVLEPLYLYLTVAMRQYEDGSFAGYYNVGPDDEDCIATGELVDLFCGFWGGEARGGNRYDGGPHEANFLKLDCSRVKKTFGWRPRYHVSQAVEKTVEWTKEWLSGGDVRACTDRQVEEFFMK